MNYIYSSENVNRVANKEPIYINVSYDGENDNFIIEETETPVTSEEENLNLLSENEDDEDSELPENTDDEGDSKLSGGSEDEENTDPESSVNTNGEAAVSQKESDDFESAKKDFSKKEKD